MKRAQTHILRTVFTIFAVAVLVGLPTAFAINSEQSLNRALEEKERAKQSLAAIENRLVQNTPEPVLSDEPFDPEPEFSDIPFEPEHPCYEDLYPDFYAPQKLTVSNTSTGVIYLTFDDGPSARTDEILAVLDRENIKATFFVVGQTSEANLQRMRDIAEQGHTIAMHSYSHKYTRIYASVQENAKHPSNPIMFPSPVTGKLYGPDCLGRLHKNLLKKAGITENIPFHGLRHTFATLAIQQGVDAKTVSSILGHYSAGFTLDAYIHVTGEMQKEAAQRMVSFMAQHTE